MNSKEHAKSCPDGIVARDKSTFAWILANPFYYGLVRLKATGQLFEGRHQPLISHTLFKAVREVSTQRLNKRVIKHDFPYRRSVRCGECGYNLTGECVKGIVYYRCHTKTCQINAIRDDHLTVSLLNTFSLLEMPEDERRFLYGVLDDLTKETQQQRTEVIQSLKSTLGNVQERLSRLADAYLDGILDRNVLQEKQKALLEERKEIEGRLDTIQQRHDLMVEKLREFLDFAGSVKAVFEVSAPAIRQQLLRRVALRVTVTDRAANVVLHKPYQLFASRSQFQSTTGNGVGTSGSHTLNSGMSDNDALNIGQNSSECSIASSNGRSGCPSPSGVKTGAKALLLEISRELIDDPSSNV